MRTAVIQMPAPLLSRALLLAAALLLAVAAVAQNKALSREPELLSEKEYPVQLEEVVVRAQQPKWREKAAPDWERPKFELKTDTQPPRLQLAPKYERDERDDYMDVRDRMNAEPRLKLFEFKF